MTKTVLITGASSGIGLDLAELFAKDKYDLVLVARSKVKLDEVAKDLSSKFNVGIKVFAFDLANPKNPKELFDAVKKESIQIDVLVNNAGYGTNGFFPEMDEKAELEMIQLNVTTLVQLTHLFSKEMVERKKGKILNVASVAAFQPGPFMANYYASKAYVLSFSEAIHEELYDHGVIVSALCPGPTQTNFFQRGDMGKVNFANESVLMMDSKEVAKIGYEGLMKGEAVVVAGVLNTIMAKSSSIIPRMLVRKITKTLNSNK